MCLPCVCHVHQGQHQVCMLVHIFRFLGTLPCAPHVALTCVRSIIVMGVDLLPCVPPHVYSMCAPCGPHVGPMCPHVFPMWTNSFGSCEATPLACLLIDASACCPCVSHVFPHVPTHQRFCMALTCLPCGPHVTLQVNIVQQFSQHTLSRSSEGLDSCSRQLLDTYLTFLFCLYSGLQVHGHLERVGTLPQTGPGQQPKTFFSYSSV
jgi:hypothetical protein